MQAGQSWTCTLSHPHPPSWQCSFQLGWHDVPRFPQTKIRPNVILPYTLSYQRFLLHQSLKLYWLQYFSQNHKSSKKELEKTLPVCSPLSVSQHVGTNFMHHHVFSCISYDSYSSHGTTQTVIQKPRNAGVVNGHNTSSPNMSIRMNLSYWSITTKISDYEFWRTKKMAEAEPNTAFMLWLKFAEEHDPEFSPSQSCRLVSSNRTME